jgi:hypothetical protein
MGAVSDEAGELEALRQAFPGYRFRRRTLRGVPCYLAEARNSHPKPPALSAAPGPAAFPGEMLAADVPLVAARSPSVLADMLAVASGRPVRLRSAAVAAAYRDRRLTMQQCAVLFGVSRTTVMKFLTFAALGAGKLDPTHVRIIEDLTSVLSDEDAALADRQLAGMALSKTYAELRRAGNRLVVKLDPEAARKRKEKARREKRVRSFREESGNAGISGRELPSVEVLASMQHVEDRARALRDAGVPGPWEELKARALLDLLQERDSRPAPGEPSADGQASDSSGANTSDPGGPGSGGPGLSGPGPSRPGPGGPSVGALVTITVPHTALNGDTGPGGDVDGFGLLDHADTRDLIAAAAASPVTRWCLTTVYPDGTAATHACATGPRPWGSEHGPPGEQPGSATLSGLLDLLNITQLVPVIRGPCEHTRAEGHYRPSRKLSHRVKARNTT